MATHTWCGWTPTCPSPWTCLRLVVISSSSGLKWLRTCAYSVSSLFIVCARSRSPSPHPCVVVATTMPPLCIPVCRCVCGPHWSCHCTCSSSWSVCGPHWSCHCTCVCPCVCVGPTGRATARVYAFGRATHICLTVAFVHTHTHIFIYAYPRMLKHCHFGSSWIWFVPPPSPSPPCLTLVWPVVSRKVLSLCG